ncbi:MauE/DoxX family redox-associated membrane protein [Micromonospora sp. CPCC 206061]|uniref:MauE/DoxX family redox-associated membrane protein n=1 Tax=Micromonospora sp. CPCC 206061 TaxID=3122410 RepID=UPI002FF360ED
MPYLLLFAQCLIGLTFVLSVAGKLRGGRAFRAFEESLRGMALLPGRLVRPVAAVVVAAEAAVPVLLPLPGSPFTTAGFLLGGALLAAFTAAVALVLRRGTAAECRCFGGTAPAPLRRHHIVRNAALIAVAAAGAYAAWRGTATTGQAAAVAAPLGLVAALAVAYLDDLLALFAPARPGAFRKV